MTGQPRRLNRRRAGRLLDGDREARAGDAKLAALIDALGADEPDDEGGRQTPAELLAAFARQAEPVPRPRHRTGARSRNWSRHTRSALTVKTAAVVLVLSGGTVAAAAGDALPAPAQRAAHELFGSWGVPAPTASTDGPQTPVPSTGPVLREGTSSGGSSTGGTASIPASGAGSGVGPSSGAPADASGGASADAGRTTAPSTSDCATRTHGKSHHCDPDQTSSPVTNGLASGVGTVASTPAPTPAGHGTHTPPGRAKHAEATPGV